MTTPSPRLTQREIIQRELQAIYTRTQALTAETVVVTATPEDHPLHPFFTWDDSEAAHQHRLTEARALIRSVKVTFVVEEPDEQIRTVTSRQWQSAHRAGLEDPRGRYIPSEDIGADPQLREAFLRQMRREIASLRARYGDIQEFWRLLAEMLNEREENDPGE